MQLARFRFYTVLLLAVPGAGASRLDDLLNTAWHMRVQARYTEAEQTLREAEPLARSLPEGDHRRLVVANELGTVLTSLGRFEEAASILENVLPVAKRTAPERHIVLAMTLASAYHNHGRVRDAETLLRRVLRESAAASPGDRATAKSLLGRVSLDLGHLKVAERYCREALREQEAVLGPAHRETYTTLSTLASLYLRSGRLRDAERTARRVVNLSLIGQKRGHPDEAKGRLLLGMAVRRASRPKEAREQFESALAIFQKALGPAHPMVSVTRYNIAGLDADAGDLLRARAQLEVALHATERVLGRSHRQVAEILALHSEVLHRLGERAEALKAKARVDEIIKTHWVRNRSGQIDIAALAIESR